MIPVAVELQNINQYILILWWIMWKINWLYILEQQTCESRVTQQYKHIILQEIKYLVLRLLKHSYVIYWKL